jgi:hypothetical protein
MFTGEYSSGTVEYSLQFNQEIALMFSIGDVQEELRGLPGGIKQEAQSKGILKCFL